MPSSYAAKINLAIDYIEKNIRGDLKLDNIAKAAGFSPFHFHRIFSTFMNESLNHFVRRVRAGKAATMLFSNPNYSITQIAFKNGYSSSQSFAREFRVFYRTTPQKYRESKICHSSSKNGKAYRIDVCYHKDDSKRTGAGAATIVYNSLSMKNMKVEIKTLPDMTLAYIRHIGPYKGNPELFGKLFGDLCTWAGPRNLLQADSKYLCIYYDGPEVTDESKLRLDVCLVVPKDTEVDGEIGKQEIEGGTYAAARCLIKDPKEYETYWNELYINWLPESGYQPDDKVPFELYAVDCRKEDGAMEVDICIPVKKV